MAVLPTAAELDRWQEACEKTISGEWKVWSNATAFRKPNETDYVIVNPDFICAAIVWGGYSFGEANAAFIALAREALPRLIAAYRERCEWRPIETAPKDGTSVLLSREESAIEGFWRKDAGQWDSALGWLGTELVTHWMPLPKGPDE